MGAQKRGGARVVRTVRQESEPPPELRQSTAGAGLIAALIEEIDEERRQVSLRIGEDLVPAYLDPSVSTVVMRTALANHERVITQREAGSWVVVGALRTTPTPGVDIGDEFLIKARRVLVVAEHEFGVVSGAASIVVRAQGVVETVAQDITTRASSLHKIIGRMIRLN
jgi:hypothetical protein